MCYGVLLEGVGVRRRARVERQSGAHMDDCDILNQVRCGHVDDHRVCDAHTKTQTNKSAHKQTSEQEASRSNSRLASPRLASPAVGQQTTDNTL